MLRTIISLELKILSLQIGGRWSVVRGREVECQCRRYRERSSECARGEVEKFGGKVLAGRTNPSEREGWKKEKEEFPKILSLCRK